MKIVSLLPSATEILCLLGLEDQLCGVTHECDYPPAVRALPKVTHTLIPYDAPSGEIDSLVRERLQGEQALYRLDLPTLERLQPDVIVTQALCDVCAVAESEVEQAARNLASRPAIINLEPSRLEEVFQCIEAVGKVTHREQRAAVEIERLRQRVDAIVERSAQIAERPRVMLLEWIDPPFSAGHWSPELVRLAGGEEVLGQEAARSETISWQKITEADPEVLVIACCGFDVERTLQDIPRLQSAEGYESWSCVKNSRVYVVDGSAFFSRPGPRLVDSLEVLAHTLHPSLHPLPQHLSPAVHVTPALPWPAASDRSAGGDQEKVP